MSSSTHLQGRVKPSDIVGTGSSICPLPRSNGQQNVSSLAAQAASCCNAVLANNHVPSWPGSHIQLVNWWQIAIIYLFTIGMSEGSYFTSYVALNVRISQHFSVQKQTVCQLTPLKYGNFFYLLISLKKLSWYKHIGPFVMPQRKLAKKGGHLPRLTKNPPQKNTFLCLAFKDFLQRLFVCILFKTNKKEKQTTINHLLSKAVNEQPKHWIFINKNIYKAGQKFNLPLSSLSHNLSCCKDLQTPKLFD